MSNSRISQCLAQASCNMTERGKAVWKSSMIGLMAGALSGAAMGGLSVGFHDIKLRDDGIRNFTNDHRNEYPTKCHRDRDGTQHCEQPELDAAADRYGLQYAEDEIAKVGPWIAVGCTAGLAVVGFFAGVVRGWVKELPVVHHDIESQSAPYVRIS